MLTKVIFIQIIHNISLAGNKLLFIIIISWGDSDFFYIKKLFSKHNNYAYCGGFVVLADTVKVHPVNECMAFFYGTEHKFDNEGKRRQFMK